jgi:ABC-type glycerol-3-phosphate transport system substrate-binding protein
MLKGCVVMMSAAVALSACGESRDPALEWVGSYTLNGTTSSTCTGNGTETYPIADTLTITAVTAGEVNFSIDDDACAPFAAKIKDDSVTVQSKVCPPGALRQGFSARTTTGEFRQVSTGEDLEGHLVIMSFSGSYSYTWSYSGDAVVGPFNCTATDTLTGTRI